MKYMYKESQKISNDAFETVCRLPVIPLLNHSDPLAMLFKPGIV